MIRDFRVISIHWAGMSGKPWANENGFEKQSKFEFTSFAHWLYKQDCTQEPPRTKTDFHSLNYTILDYLFNGIAVIFSIHDKTILVWAYAMRCARDIDWWPYIRVMYLLPLVKSIVLGSCSINATYGIYADRVVFILFYDNVACSVYPLSLGCMALKRCWTWYAQK